MTFRHAYVPNKRPCPFCNSDNIDSFDHSDQAAAKIFCDDCHATGPRGSHMEARTVTRWNTHGFMPPIKDGLTACPWCRNIENLVYEKVDSHTTMTGHEYRIACKLCKCAGPIERDEQDAADAWNIRKREADATQGFTPGLKCSAPDCEGHYICSLDRSGLKGFAIMIFFNRNHITRCDTCGDAPVTEWAKTLYAAKSDPPLVEVPRKRF